ncbi:hypothetical protein QQS21_004098 [Conoideocrella luteorostrata]|uniref:Hydrophobin n=1 Tax=Conoideocrella luteorostrata TaxID=1105319 RepID=A0AAJ0CUY0_9HYPO|nr:hypothetical protein QQS21_004098 [Conoideocrella luteorostrata]
MAIFNVLLAAAAISTALAVPTYGHNSHDVHTGKITTLGDAASQCGNHQTISCCNSGDTESNGGLIGSLLDGVAGGNCAALSVPVIAVDVPITSACTGQVACCSGDTNGLVNLECTSIAL